VAAEDHDLDLEAAKSTCAMAMLVKIVRLVLLGVFAEGVHLRVYAGVNVSANGRVRRGVLGREFVNEHHGRESILSGVVGEYVGARGFGLSVHLGE